MRRLDWRTDDSAVALVLLGVLVAAAAASLYASVGTPNDIVGCPSLAAVDRPGPDLYGVCSAFRDDRAHLVRRLAVAALVVAGLGGLSVVVPRTRGRTDLEPSWSAPLWCLLPPVVFAALVAVTAPASQANDGISTSLGQVFVAGGVFLAWVGASALRAAPVRAHLLVAAAVVVPVACAAVAVIETLRRPGLPGARKADFPFLGGWSPLVCTALAMAVAFAVATALAKAERPAPNIWIGGALFALSTAVTLPVFQTDLVPAWRNVDASGYDGPGLAVWLPLLLAPAVLAALVWAAHALRRDPTAGPTRPAPRSAERGARRLGDAIRGL